MGWTGAWFNGRSVGVVIKGGVVRKRAGRRAGRGGRCRGGGRGGAARAGERACLGPLRAWCSRAGLG